MTSLKSLLLIILLTSCNALAYDVAGMLPSIDGKYDDAIRHATQASAVTLGVSQKFDAWNAQVQKELNKYGAIAQGYIYAKFGKERVLLLVAIGDIVSKKEIRFDVPVEIIGAKPSMHLSTSQIDFGIRWDIK